MKSNSPIQSGKISKMTFSVLYNVDAIECSKIGTINEDMTMVDGLSYITRTSPDPRAAAKMNKATVTFKYSRNQTISMPQGWTKE